jgi:hypothetical protein
MRARMRWFLPFFAAAAYLLIVVSLILPRGAVFGRMENTVWTIAGVAALLTLLSWVWMGLQLRRALPEQPRLEPAPNAEISPRMRELDEAVRGLGFRSVMSPARVATRPPTLMLVYLHESEPVYASVERVHHSGDEHVALSFATELDGGERGLESTDFESAGLVPKSPAVFFQILPGLDAPRLLEFHRRALAELATRGHKASRAREDRMERTLIRAWNREREFLRESAFRHAAGMLWKISTRNPGPVGPLRL